VRNAGFRLRQRLPTRIPDAGHPRQRAREHEVPTADGPAAAKRSVFGALAASWDAAKPEEAVAAGVGRGLALLGDLAGLVVVDIGCGPGRLEPFLLPHLGTGRVVAVDFAPEMIAQGTGLCPDPRVTWLCRDVLDTGLDDSCADLVLCFNAFPHFPDPEAVLREAWRWLAPGGRLLLWHDLGRERLAEVHRRAGRAVEGDLLLPAATLAATARSVGLLVERAGEDETSYTFLARRPA